MALDDLDSVLFGFRGCKDNGFILVVLVVSLPLILFELNCTEDFGGGSIANKPVGPDLEAESRSFFLISDSSAVSAALFSTTGVSTMIFLGSRFRLVSIEVFLAIKDVLFFFCFLKRRLDEFHISSEKNEKSPENGK